MKKKIEGQKNGNSRKGHLQFAQFQMFAADNV
jgi:hypothetical protein